jgi:hypothetical protein
MSDQNKFVNTYIDTIIAMVHEQTNSILQLKTQLKLAGITLAEKEKVCNDLQSEIETLKKQFDTDIDQSLEIQIAKKDAKYWENSYHAISNKVSHMDNLSKQYNELKTDFLKQKEQLNIANEKITQFESSVKLPKKVINIKNKETIVDDFS